VIILKANWIVPITKPPIENGWIRIENGVIVDFGNKDSSAHPPLCDLGNCAIFPGLINAHAHLEFDRGDHPRDSFAAWVKSIIATQKRDSVGAPSLEQRWEQNIRRLVETGTTSIVNHCNQLLLSGRVLPPHLPHIIHVCEIVGSSPERGAES
jgi:cytosine/adenosine deaminase-related metal-dependent hydrolase